MTNERAKADLNDILDGFAQQMRTITQLQKDRAVLTATATVRKRVTVTVNAEGTVIETRFASDIEDLDYEEIAKAVTEAAQQAAAEVVRRPGGDGAGLAGQPSPAQTGRTDSGHAGPEQGIDHPGPAGRLHRTPELTGTSCGAADFGIRWHGHPARRSHRLRVVGVARVG
ncbi:YbaB/EbfC family nucleoid-associated protein [Nocardia crassostreae]|uniref:YbaB/EbfC family nucleoid-associated protein n=1 Tax=Nocardia crassostreae TaxID=53428 RepID=UPI000A8F7037|nr:YbaB/EbfC family nucleoid-associated protein [Nocardia crassostreae]